MSALTEEMTQLAGAFTFLRSSVPIPVGAQAVPLCQANPLRWALIVGLSGVNVATGLTAGVTTTPSAVLGAGQLVDSGLAYAVDFRTFGTLACQAHFASTSQANPLTLDVLEVIALQ